jgi:hypothetical protein
MTDDGWYIHLFLATTNACGGQVTFGTSSDFDPQAVRYKIGGDSKGTFTIDLPMIGGADLGSGSCTVEITIT